MIRSEHLLYFVTVVRTASINAAALQLNVTPPAISHALKKLEDELGLTLLARSSKGVEMTTAGKELYGYAKDIVAMLQTFETTAQRLRESQKMNFEFDIPQCVLFGESSILDSFFAAISRHLYAKNPSLDLIIANKPIHEVLTEIEDDPFTFAFLLLGSDTQKQILENHPNVSQIIISSQNLVVLAKKNSQWLASLKPKYESNTVLNIEDIVTLPYIAISWNSSSSSSFMNLLKSYGTPNIVNIAPSISILVSFLENDIGIALGIHSINQLTTSKQITEIPLNTHNNFTLDYIFLHNSAANPAIIQWFTQIIHDSFEEAKI